MNNLLHGSPTSPPEDEDSGIATSALAEDLKITAAEIEGDQCPRFILNLSKQIAVHLERARKAEGKAEQHYIAIQQLLEKAKQNCDAGGFAAFQAKFCPDLGRSRTYELKAIATGKKTIEDARASSRERQARCRARKAESVTVTDSSPVMDAGKPAEQHKLQNDKETSAPPEGIMHLVQTLVANALGIFFAQASVADILARLSTATRDQIRARAVSDYFKEFYAEQSADNILARLPPGLRAQVCDLALDEFFTLVSGDNILKRIRAAKRNDTMIADFLDALGVDGLHKVVSAKFAQQLRATIPGSKTFKTETAVQCGMDASGKPIFALEGRGGRSRTH
jgi:hypothetical protein